MTRLTLPAGLRVLVVGGGGREHALAWACRRSRLVGAVHCAPGNGGTPQVATNHAVAATDGAGLARLARELEVQLAVLGPDAAVAAGVGDQLTAAGIPCVGPSAAAGRVESSKAHAKACMVQAGIASADFAVFDDWPAARDHIRAQSHPLVVKADGPCLGKGVFVCDDGREALRHAEALLQEGRLGAAGRRVVVEERLEGKELSLFALCDGERAVMLPSAEDYKRRRDGDRGPMTGGMGAVTPPQLAGWRDHTATALDTIVLPLLRELERQGTPYRGCLYVGAMLARGRLHVLEFNARFGDPEAEVLLPMLPDPVPWFWELAQGRLELPAPEPRPGHAVGVVVAAADYPEQPLIGQPITVPDPPAGDTLVFHMGTRRDPDGVLRASGGRVLCCVGTGPDRVAARARALAAVAAVQVPGADWRRDIAADH